MWFSIADVICYRWCEMIVILYVKTCNIWIFGILNASLVFDTWSPATIMSCIKSHCTQHDDLIHWWCFESSSKLWRTSQCVMKATVVPKQAQLKMEALKAESERSKEEKQRITEQLLLQHKDLESHCQVSRHLYPPIHNVGIEFSSGILHLITKFIGFHFCYLQPSAVST